jgi:hypothetical protein
MGGQDVFALVFLRSAAHQRIARKTPNAGAGRFLEKGAFRFSKLPTKSLLEMQRQDYSRNRRKGR